MGEKIANCIVKIHKDGEVTIPETYREYLGLKHGDSVSLIIKKV